MNPSLQRILRDLAPPAALRLYRRHVLPRPFSSPFASWEEARAVSSGYDADVIVERVLEATLKVKRGEALFERDSVLFDRAAHSWPLLAGLLWVAAQRGGRLSVADFGGSLGSLWFQYRVFLSALPQVRWSVVEQPKFVEPGRRLLQDGQLRFHLDLSECLADGECDVLLLSGVLPYLEAPHDFLRRAAGLGFQFILIDRTPCLEQGEDRLTVQRVPPEVYPASYPAWFLDTGKLVASLAPRYELVEAFDSFEAWDLGDVQSQARGFIFRQRTG